MNISNDWTQEQITDLEERAEAAQGELADWRNSFNALDREFSDIKEINLMLEAKVKLLESQRHPSAPFWRISNAEQPSEHAEVLGIRDVRIEGIQPVWYPIICVF